MEESKSVWAKMKNFYSLMKMHLPEVDVENGILSTSGRRHFVMPVEAMAHLSEGLGRIVSEAAPALLYQAGKTGGKIEGRIGIELVGRDLDKFKEYCVISASSSGWGRHEILHADKEKLTAVIRVHNAPIAEFNTGDKPVCSFHLGFVTGLIEEFFGVEMQGTETKCKGKGDEYCEFEIQGRGCKGL